MVPTNGGTANDSSKRATNSILRAQTRSPEGSFWFVLGQSVDCCSWVYCFTAWSHLINVSAISRVSRDVPWVKLSNVRLTTQPSKFPSSPKMKKVLTNSPSLDASVSKIRKARYGLEPMRISLFSIVRVTFSTLGWRARWFGARHEGLIFVRS